MKVLAINSSLSMGKGNAIRGGHRPARLRPARGDPPSQGPVDRAEHLRWRPLRTDPKAYFAFNQGPAWADLLLWAPLQVAGSVGMLLGEQWGFLLALVASVPFWYSAVPLFIWDRDMGFRKKTVAYWVVTWGMFPAYGVVETGYCMVRFLAKE